jgi:hypothetical protein
MDSIGSNKLISFNYMIKKIVTVNKSNKKGDHMMIYTKFFKKQLQYLISKQSYIK